VRDGFAPSELSKAADELTPGNLAAWLAVAETPV